MSSSASRSEIMRRLWNNPEYRAKKTASNKAAAIRRGSDPNYRAKLSASAKLKWQDPISKASRLAAMKHLGPERSERMKRRWQDPEMRARMLATRAKTWEDPQRRARVSVDTKRRLADPEVAARQIAGTASNNRRWPYPAEAACQHILDNLGIAYNFQQVIAGTIVDFELPNHNVILEIDGKGTHTGKVRQRDQMKERAWRSCGYSVMRLTNRAVMRYDGRAAIKVLERLLV